MVRIAVDNRKPDGMMLRNMKEGDAFHLDGNYFVLVSHHGYSTIVENTTTHERHVLSSFTKVTPAGKAR